MAETTGYPALVHPDPEGGFCAEVLALPGCVTEGETLDELVLNLNEAVTGWLEADRMRKASGLTDADL